MEVLPSKPQLHLLGEQVEVHQGQLEITQDKLTTEVKLEEQGLPLQQGLQELSQHLLHQVLIIHTVPEAAEVPVEAGMVVEEVEEVHLLNHHKEELLEQLAVLVQEEKVEHLIHLVQQPIMVQVVDQVEEVQVMYIPLVLPLTVQQDVY